ncbi:MAG: response regulator, partial [Proteobacteria bacterium]|nr:response regulator [Pseudomonadota bacterium]
MDLNMNVLVVDDFATMRRIIKNVLKQIGFTKILEAD